MEVAQGPGAGAAQGGDARRPGAGLLRQLPLLLLLLGYTWLGLTAADLTALWQVPDEPAHFNQVGQRLEGREPVIEVGDYPFDLVARIQGGGLRSVDQVSAVQYEDHQPPLYYVLGAALLRRLGPDDARSLQGQPIQVPTDDLLRLRYLSLLLGACTLLLFWWATGLFRPGDLTLRIAVTAFAAFLPMQLHLNSGVNNDALAFAVCAAALGLALRRLGPDGRRPATWGGAVVAGLGMGVAALSKLSALLPTVLLLLGAELLARWGQRQGEAGAQGPARGSPSTTAPTSPSTPTPSSTPSSTAAAPATAASSQPPLLPWLVLAVGLSLLVAGPWLRHNIVHYGWADPLALAAHDQATACPPGAPADCQPRTDAWIAEHGFGDLLDRGLRFTFASFWGVFGWMSVFLGRLKGIPIYGALALVSLVALVGLLRRLAQGWLQQGGWLRRAQTILLLLHLGATFGGFLWYNLSFVQHQGRYLLPALLPLALAFSAGLRAALRELAVGLGSAPRPAQRLGQLSLLGWAAGLALLAWVSVFRYIYPALGIIPD